MIPLSSVLFLAYCVVNIVNGDPNFNHTMELNPNYFMWWKFDDEYITIKVKVKTKGKLIF